MSDRDTLIKVKRVRSLTKDMIGNRFSTTNEVKIVTD